MNTNVVPSNPYPLPWTNAPMKPTKPSGTMHAVRPIPNTRVQVSRAYINSLARSADPGWVERQLVRRGLLKGYNANDYAVVLWDGEPVPWDTVPHQVEAIPPEPVRSTTDSFELFRLGK